MMLKRIIKEHPIKVISFFLCITVFISIRFWAYYAPLPISDWNKKGISRIKISDPENFSFAVFGDNKGNSSVFEPLLRDIDRRMDIAFAIGVGDLVGSGKIGQYRYLLNQIQKYLTIPFVAVPGNHDFNKINGFSNYRQVFGPTYYTFQIGQAYFIVLDSTKESSFDKAELRWLDDELQKAQTSKVLFVFMHIPPFNPRGGSGFLPEKDRKDLSDLLRRYNVSHLFASHVHGYFSGVWEGVPYTVTGGAGGRLQGSDPEYFFHHYIQARVNNGEVETVVRRINGMDATSRFLDLIEDYGLEGGLLLGAGISLVTLGVSMKRKRRSSSPESGIDK